MNAIEKSAQLFKELPSVLAKKIWSSTIKFIEDTGLPHNSFCATLIWTGYFHSIRKTLDKHSLTNKVLDQYVYTVSALYEIPLHDVERLAKLKQFLQVTLDHLAELDCDLCTIDGVIKFLCISADIIDNEASTGKDQMPSSERITAFLSLSLELSDFVEKFIPSILALAAPLNRPAPASPQEPPPANKNSKKKDITFYFPFFFVGLVAVFITIFVLLVNNSPSRISSPSTAATTTSSQSTHPTITESTTEGLPAPYKPKNGQVFLKPRASALAPLTIETIGTGGYFFYLKNISDDNANMSFYVTAGKTVDVEVPLGTYIIYYATGSTWYGTDYLFGPGTVYRKFNGVFSFTSDSSGYSGWTIQLQPVTDGNLDSEYINESEFPQ